MAQPAHPAACSSSQPSSKAPHSRRWAQRPAQYRRPCKAPPTALCDKTKVLHALHALGDQMMWRGAAAALAAAAVLAAGAPALAAAPAPLYDPMQYVGRWYEVASLKKGFAGEGQADCHCTQGTYTPREDPSGNRGLLLEVNTFCVHGGSEGWLSGIQVQVSCANPELLQLLPEFETPLEQEERIEEKCVLRFPSLPFIPAEPYDVIRTDYTSYALVQGAKDRSVVQIYSRTPNPGPELVARQKATLQELGYPVEEIQDTPQDCSEMQADKLMAMMQRSMSSYPRMPPDTPKGVAMRGYDLGPVKGVAFEGQRSALQSVKDVLKLFKGGSG